MRRVEILKWEKVEGEAYSEKVRSGEYGFLHAWGIDCEDFDQGAGSYSTAIIEKPDGTVVNVHCEMIRFINKE